MKIFLKLACGLVGLTLAACAPALPQRPEQLAYPPLEFHIPEVETLELANGMRVYLREDSELPLVQVTAMIGSGALAATPAENIDVFWTSGGRGVMCAMPGTGSRSLICWNAISASPRATTAPVRSPPPTKRLLLNIWSAIPNR